MRKTITLSINTDQKKTFIDITDKIGHLVKESGVTTGEVILFVPHTTAGVTINENADPDVLTDMIAGFDGAYPDRSSFRHMEGNSDAHLKSSAVGNDQLVLIENGNLALGTWQGLYFCEFDGPRQRKLLVRLQGE